jgi:hypothetical protein
MFAIVGLKMLGVVIVVVYLGWLGGYNTKKKWQQIGDGHRNDDKRAISSKNYNRFKKWQQNC